MSTFEEEEDDEKEDKRWKRDTARATREENRLIEKGFICDYVMHGLDVEESEKEPDVLIEEAVLLLSKIDDKLDQRG